MLFSRRAILVTSIVMLRLISSQESLSQSVGFMPGDAFFVFCLDEKTVASLPEKGGRMELVYDMPEYPFGKLYAGFGHLRVENADPSLSQSIRRVYKDYRFYVPKVVEINHDDNGVRQETELNMPLALVYNGNVDWAEQRIGLKYNEDWPHLPALASVGPVRCFSVPEPACVYQPLIRTFDAVEADWGGARTFEGLSIRTPKDIAWGKWGSPINKPVVVNGPDIQVIVVGKENLEKYFLRRPDYKFYQVKADGINVCWWEWQDENCTLIKTKLADDRGSDGGGDKKGRREKSK
jgi:hypothetical protein